MKDGTRVVVTGVGVVSSVGVGTKAFWESLVEGRSGIAPITAFDAGGFRCRIAGEVRDFDVTKYMTPKEARRFDRFTHLVIGAGEEALAQAGVSSDSMDPERIGAIVGCGIGGIRTLEDQCYVLRTKGPARCSPLMVPMMIGDMAAGYISIRYGFRGPNIGVQTACASASHAIGEAYWTIKRGDADVIVTGGVEAPITPVGIAGFASMRALSERNDEPERASRPFDAERDGFVPAEGAGILILEALDHARARGADILAELVGYGATADAYHITAPDPAGKGPTEAIRIAMERADMTPEDIDYVNAHGTSTPLNDKVETLALKTALGDHAYRVPVSSTKSMTGHALGAAGGIESVACIMALQTGIVPGTMNYENPDPECDLDYVPNAARRVNPKTAMNINLGFGGHNAVLIFKKFG